MSSDSPEEGFRVTDRRRRTGDDPPRVEPSTTARAEASEPEGSPHDLDPARSLAGLFVMFASSALVALGESPDPLTRSVQRDLAQASDAIDILTLLREKTEGNRTEEETQLLEQIIHDLQMRFVRATASPSGPPGAPPRR